MDLLQTAIKTLFYDIQPERVYRLIKILDPQKENKFLMASLKELGKWSNEVFSGTEIDQLTDYCKQVQSQNNKAGIYGLPYILLFDLVRGLIDYNNGSVYLRYNHILRWQHIAAFIGEDIPVSLYHAKNNYPTDFIWPDALEHNEPIVNAMLSEGVADIHSHLNGSYAAFELGWINRMNRMNTSVSDNPFGGRTRNLTIDRTDGELNHFDWMVIAARIRIILFKALRYKNYDVKPAIDEIIKLHDGNAQRIAALRSLISDASSLATNSKRCNDAYNRHWDYALDNVSWQIASSPYLTLRGERWLTYSIVKDSLSGGRAKDMLALLYLYHVIKLNCRKEMILSNDRIGLSNFQSFEASKLFLQKDDGKLSVSDAMILRYAVQTAIGNSHSDSVELRCNLDTFDKLHKYKLYQNIFDTHSYIDKNFLGCLTFVNILSKSKTTRELLHDDSLKLVHYRKYNDKNDARGIPYLQLTGIDVGGNDMEARPELFAQAFRYCKGKCGRTFHAGEDYADAVDSLRYLDEAYTFFELQRGDRIGHALVLGENLQDFYYKRNYTVFLRRINLIDNIVWLICRCKELNVPMPQALEQSLENIAITHYRELKIPVAWSITDYWQSMLIRSNTTKDPLHNADYARCCTPKNLRCHGTDVAKTIWSLVRKNKSRNIVYVQFVWPHEVLPLICSIQEALLKKFQNKGIFIESCPTGNRIIGHFKRYDEHPLLNFAPIDYVQNHTPPVSINTDERGIFATSIRREYSLMCLAIEKKLQKEQGLSETVARRKSIDYMTRILQSAKSQIFKQ